MVVKFSQGLTISSNYNSWRLDCGVELPIGKLTPEEAFDKAKIMVEEQLVGYVKENKADMKEIIAKAKKSLE